MAILLELDGLWQHIGAMSTAFDIHADPSCPWCYLGVSRFEIAYQDFDPDIFSLQISPFLINPDLPVNGMDFESYLMARFGDQKAVAEALLPLQKGTEESEIPINLDKIKVMPNTFKAQLLLQWAGETGLDYPLFRLMQEAHFVKGLDLSLHAVLRALAEEVGMDGALVSELLNEGKNEDALVERMRENARAGIREVPSFVIGNSYVVQGVQPISFWRNVISEIDEKGRELLRARLN